MVTKDALYLSTLIPTYSKEVAELSGPDDPRPRTGLAMYQYDYSTRVSSGDNHAEGSYA